VLAAADRIVHVGDFTAASVLDELRELAPVAAVHGNMDEPELRALLPERSVVEEEGLTIGLIHDPGPTARRHERLRGSFPGCGLVVYGHTHWPELVSDEGVWFLNPGSPTERRRAPGHTMAFVREGVPSLVDVGS
jgi:putative phosphoesterase